jgi:hypothetical protein
MTETTKLYCINHPSVETTLRCNRCDRPICAKCAIKTPTGYRCPECVRSQLKVFDTAVWYDYPLAFVVAGVLSLIASGLVTLVGIIGFFGWIILVIAAPTIGTIIAEGVRLAIRRHRSRALFLTAVAAVALGALPVILTIVLTLNYFGLIYQGIYLFLAIPTVYYRLSGIQLFK